jgi:hypothetical protein
MPFVSITRLRLRSPEFLEPFFLDTIAADEQARAAAGNLGAELLAEPTNAYWTKTLWVDRSAMRAFMTSGPHGESMPRLRGWCDEAHVVHWDQETGELPTWTEAHRRLVSEGRRSAVEHPTPAHESMQIPPPRE